MGGITHAKLRHLETGTIRERRFRADETVKEVTPERQNLQFLYRDDRLAHFMPPETFEQVDIETDRLGRAVGFLTESMTVPVEFVNAQPIGVMFPDVVEMKVVDTAPAAHGGATTVWKETTLENGVTIMVPPFIATGETVRMNVERSTYVERVKTK
jgi:elongation factor P